MSVNEDDEINERELLMNKDDNKKQGLEKKQPKNIGEQSKR